jgi:hypothetical protein
VIGERERERGEEMRGLQGESKRLTCKSHRTSLIVNSQAAQYRTTLLFNLLLFYSNNDGK